MYNFSTMTIVNSLKDSNGVDMFTSTNDVVRVNRVGKFSKGEVVSVAKKEAEDMKVPVSTITAPAVTKGDVYRLVINIELNKSESSLYALPWPTKGKEIQVEAIAPDATGAKLAETLVANAKAYMNLVYDKEILKVTHSGAVVTVTGVEGTQVLKSVVIEHWVADDKTFAGGRWEVVAEGAVSQKSNPGFGTYNHLIQNYKLPTLENTRFGGILAEETPILGAKYDQYVVRIRTVRDPYGVGAVGQELVSVTEHVFWANQADGVSAALGAALDKVDPAKTTESSVLDE